MIINPPKESQLYALRQLWKQAFGDPEDFIHLFFDTAFAFQRCRCLTEDGKVAAALYWFDCQAGGGKIAYLYAVATDRLNRGRGLCRKLMEDTHAHLRRQGYAGTILVPGSDALFTMYRGMGYETCSAVEEFRCEAAGPVPPIRPVDPEEYARLRKKMLPAGGVIQEGENLTFLAAQAKLYAGPDFLLAAASEGDTLRAAELLGPRDRAPGIVKALGAKEGLFRTPGTGRDFAMYHPLTDAPPPAYFGLAFD